VSRLMWRLALTVVVAAMFATSVSAQGTTDRAASTASSTPAPVVAHDPKQQVLVLLNMPPAHFRADGNYSGGYSDVAGSSARRRVASSLASANGLKLANDWPMPILALDCYVMDVPAQLSPADVAAQLARDPRVQWAQVMNMFASLADGATPSREVRAPRDDPRADARSDTRPDTKVTEPAHEVNHDDPLFTLQPAAREWRLSELHARATGRDVRIAIIDSSVQLDHPDLLGQIVENTNFVADRVAVVETHGTAVAGIIAAKSDNHLGIVGIAPKSRLLALRGCWQAASADTLCTTLSLALALHMAIDHDARIINMSLGGPPDRLIRQLIDAALARGIFVVAAANRSAPNGGFPAEVRGVVAVVDRPMANAPAGTIVAPGTDVPTTVPGSKWATVSGASYAAAHVSGLLALMVEARANARLDTPSAQRMRQVADRTSATTAVALVTQDDGRVDACATLARAAAACVCDCVASAATESIARH
jgi:hypothetical protein